MLLQLRRSIVLVVVFGLFLGLAYPAVEVAAANVIFPARASGSVTRYGSPLIGQDWKGTSWFHGRPDSDNPLATGGTNLGPTSKQLVSFTKRMVAYWHSHGVDPTQELVTTSGSGIDPDISPQSAYVQIPMVSRSTHIPAKSLDNLIASQIHGRQYGILGERYVNVLSLNLALKRLEATVQR